MPPYTEGAMILHQESFHSLPSSPSSGVAGGGLGSGHQRDKIFPDRMVALQSGPPPAAPLSAVDAVVARDRAVAEFAAALRNLQDHVDHLLANPGHDAAEARSAAASPANEACLYSLRHKMPRFLQRAALLIERLRRAEDPAELMAGRLRCSFGMAAAVQFLDTIEFGLACPARDIIDARLARVLEAAARLTDHDDYFAAFRVSPWVAASLRLAFDLPASRPATLELRTGLPLSVTVEPLLTYSVEDLLNVARELPPPRMCTVQIESCKHSPLEFAEGAGIIGTALVRVRVSPRQSEADDATPHSGPRSWGDEGLDKITVKEAKVIQLNSYPPKPRTAVDLYTSEGHGDPSVTLTLLVKTCGTENGEPPRLHIGLALMAPPAPPPLLLPSSDDQGSSSDDDSEEPPSFDAQD